MIEEHVPPSLYKDLLIEAYLDNTQKNNPLQPLKIEFFTNGSMIRLKNHEALIGAAWIQTKGPNPGSSFAAGISDWPLPFKVELTAILLAVLTIPFKSVVTIQTDGLSVIKKYKKLSEMCPKRTHRKWLKEKNWSLWIRLIDIIKKKELQIEFLKVQAHSDNVFNNQVDQLAKLAINEPPIFWKDLDNTILVATPT